MRQADSTIKGFLYQFDKSLYEILIAENEKTITLEGQIEDIDISSPAGMETIQCKYHEDQDYTISSVAEPILEMLCHYIIHEKNRGNIKYILYAYFEKNVDAIDFELFEDFLVNTTNQDIVVKFFPQIYQIKDRTILCLSSKTKKSKEDKEQIKNYFASHRGALSYQIELQDFFNCFEYRKAEKHDDLKNKILQELYKKVSDATAKELYYPNAFSRIAELSSRSDPIARQISKPELYKWLESQKSLLITKWLFEIREKKTVLKQKREYLSSMFQINCDVRAFVFTNTFLNDNEIGLSSFLIDYLHKYCYKEKLQKPPLFILECSDLRLLETLVVNLYEHQLTVNTGLLVTKFVEKYFVKECFVKEGFDERTCFREFFARMTVQENLNMSILKDCHVNSLFYVGGATKILTESYFKTEVLDIQSISELRYLVHLDRALKEEIK